MSVTVCHNTVSVHNSSPPSTKLVQSYVFTRVCDSVHGVGGLLHCMLGYTSQDQAPPGADAPPAQCMLGDTVNERAVCILLECILAYIGFVSRQRILLLFHDHTAKPTPSLECSQPAN